MTEPSKPSPILNLADVVIRGREPTNSPPDGYDLRRGEIASRIGARKLGYRLIVVAAGKRSCPFHNHHVDEEMFFIVEGTGELRYGDERYPLKPGDVIACPPGGPETAHQIINTGATEMSYLTVSTKVPADICEYPDSGKFGVFAGRTPDSPGQPLFRHLGKPADNRDYWEDE